MSIIRVAGFLGENRALHPMMLPEGVGSTSTNQKPGKGDLRPWLAPVTVASVLSGRKTIYRMGRDTPSDTNYWLSWATAVNVVRGFNASDNAERTYFTGSGTPKWTDNIKALTSTPYPTASRELGVPAPSSACILAASTPSITAGAFVIGTSYVIATIGTTNFVAVGASANTVGATFTATGVGAGTGTVTSNAATEVRFYSYTYVNDIGDESAPSPVSAKLTCKPDDTVTISSLASPPGGSYGINRIRVYRTSSGTTGTDFLFLRELGTTAVIAAAAAARGTVYTIVTLGTTDFRLIGAITNTLGVTFTATGAGTGTGTISSTTVTTANTTDDNRLLGEIIPSGTWLTAPGVPQGGLYNLTEPTLVQLTGMWNGMMAGISGRSVRVCEAYQPSAWPVAYEILPAETTPVALAVYGQTLLVLTNGNPILVSGGSPDALDEAPVEFLQACVAPLSVVSMGHGVAYASPDGLAYVGSSGARIITAGMMNREDWQAINPTTIIGCMHERRYFGFYTQGTRKAFVIEPENPKGIYFLDFGADAIYVDDLQDALYILDGLNIQKWDSGSALTTLFKSGTFRLPKPVKAFACAEVVADSYASVVFKLYADGVLKHTQTVLNSDPFRLPPGYTAQNFQVEVASTSPVQGMAMAHSIQELAQT